MYNSLLISNTKVIVLCNIIKLGQFIITGHSVTASKIKYNTRNDSNFGSLFFPSFFH